MDRSTCLRATLAPAQMTLMLGAALLPADAEARPALRGFAHPSIAHAGSFGGGGLPHGGGGFAPHPPGPPPPPYWDHPFWGAAAFTAGVAVTSDVIGSLVYSLPVDCSTVVVNGIGCQQCDNVWYQPRYAGTTAQYIVVDTPR